MFLDIEWSRVQGKRAAKHGNTMSWENPRQELAHGETDYLDEKGADNDVGNLKIGKYNKSNRRGDLRTSQRNDGVKARYDH